MPAATEDPTIELDSIRWERVQLILEARVVPGTAVDPATLGLTVRGGTARRRDDGADARDGRRRARDASASTSWSVRTCSRWRPGAGRSGLRSARDRAIPVRPRAAASSRSTRGLYTRHAAPSTRRAGRLHLDVTFDESIRRVDPAPPGGRARRQGRRWHPA